MSVNNRRGNAAYNTYTPLESRSVPNFKNHNKRHCISTSSIPDPLILLNRIERQQRTLTQWRQTIIKSIYKGGNKANISESQRGIFLVNIISKVYELVKITQNGKITAKCQRCKQLEGKTGQQWII